MLEQLVVNGVVAGAIYSLIALGFALIYQTSRFFHFAHGGIYTTGAYLAYLFIAVIGLPFTLGIVCAVLLASLLGGLVELAIYRPLRRRGSSSAVLLLASLGILIVMQNGVSMFFGDDSKSIRNMPISEGLSLFDARITAIQIAIVAASWGLCSLTWAILRFSRWGRTMRAVANDRELSRVVGINSDRTILASILLGSALAAVAAILIALDSDMVPLMGFHALLMGVAAVIVGGVGSVPGALVGGLFIGLVQHLGVWKLPTQWQDTVVFVMVILLLLLRPQGFAGKPLQMSSV
jgi:branched-chain amino acid transport system permease protein